MSIKIYTLLFTILLIFSFSSCNDETKEKKTQIEDVKFNSNILNKEMKIKIYTPPYYSKEKSYPVLYFMPDYGGSVFTVMDTYNIAEKADTLINSKKIEPLIIVAVDIEKSFGINSSKTVTTFETSSKKIFNKGMYKDYICEEIIPFVDSNYNTETNLRYIGGYSMGGFAALHISFSNPELFSKVGGHSPSIFVNNFPDKTVSDWLYKTDALRILRDPIYLAQNNTLNGLDIYLDVESGGSSGVKYLYDILKKNKNNVQYSELGLTHSRSTCKNNMDKYLIFYSGI